MWHTFGFEIIVAPIHLNIEPPNKSENSILYPEFRDIKYLPKLSSVIKINLIHFSLKMVNNSEPFNRKALTYMQVYVVLTYLLRYLDLHSIIMLSR